MIIHTERLILRPWIETDAEDLYLYAGDKDTADRTGFPVHKDVKDSLNVILTVLSEPETYAVCLKDNKAIGSTGIMVGKYSGLDIPDTEAEIGYWIGTPFRGNGYIPEAVEALKKRVFCELHIEKLWCMCDITNDCSKRVMEKCGFTFSHYFERNKKNTIVKKYVSCINRNDYIK